MRCENQPPSSSVKSPMDVSKRRRVSPDDQEVTDAEVEEFYAILRRIRPLTKPPRVAQPASSTWNPSFTPEDFVVRKVDEPRKEGRVRLQQEEVESGRNRTSAVNRDFDLNKDPEPETVRVR